MRCDPTYSFTERDIETSPGGKISLVFAFLKNFERLPLLDSFDLITRLFASAFPIVAFHPKLTFFIPQYNNLTLELFTVSAASLWRTTQ